MSVFLPGNISASDYGFQVYDYSDFAAVATNVSSFDYIDYGGHNNTNLSLYGFQNTTIYSSVEYNNHTSSLDGSQSIKLRTNASNNYQHKGASLEINTTVTKTIEFDILLEKDSSVLIGRTYISSANTYFMLAPRNESFGVYVYNGGLSDIIYMNDTLTKVNDSEFVHIILSWGDWDTLETCNYTLSVDNNINSYEFVPACNLSNIQVALATCMYPHLVKCYIDNFAAYNSSIEYDDFGTSGVWGFSSNIIDLIMVFIPAIIVIGVVSKFAQGFK